MSKLSIGLFRIAGAHIGVGAGGAENVFRKIVSAESGLPLADDFLLSEKGNGGLLCLGRSRSPRRAAR